MAESERPLLGREEGALAQVACELPTKSWYWRVDSTDVATGVRRRRHGVSAPASITIAKTGIAVRQVCE